MVSMKANNEIKLDSVSLDKTYPKENIQLNNGLFRYLLQPNKQLGNQKRQTTEFTRSKSTNRLRWEIEQPSNCVLYYLQDGLDKTFAHQELMRVPDDTKVPPELVSKWK